MKKQSIDSFVLKPRRKKPLEKSKFKKFIETEQSEEIKSYSDDCDISPKSQDSTDPHKGKKIRIYKTSAKNKNKSYFKLIMISTILFVAVIIYASYTFYRIVTMH